MRDSARTGVRPGFLDGRSEAKYNPQRCRDSLTFVAGTTRSEDSGSSRKLVVPAGEWFHFEKASAPRA
jgi:hypothetical protein